MIRSHIPAHLKRPFRPLDRLWRAHLLRVELSRLGGTISPRRMHRLSLGWSNGGYEADGTYLSLVAKYAAKANGPVLECGSGISTLVASAYSQHGIWSLDHMPEWVAKTNLALKQQQLPPSVVHAPLVDYDEYEWYRLPRNLPERFALVICDGPPSETTRGGRYGLLPQLSDRLSDALILVDDTSRPSDRLTVERWVAEFSVEALMTGRHTVVRCR